MRNILTALALAAVVSLAGCQSGEADKARKFKEEAKKKLKEDNDRMMAEARAKKAKEDADKKTAEAKGKVNPLDDELRDKIKGKLAEMPAGEAKKLAEEKLGALDKLLDELKTAKPEALVALQGKIADALNELKKLVGLDK